MMIANIKCCSKSSRLQDKTREHLQIIKQIVRIKIQIDTLVKYSKHRTLSINMFVT